jgi:hypothetical protein
VRRDYNSIAEKVKTKRFKILERYRSHITDLVDCEADLDKKLYGKYKPEPRLELITPEIFEYL